MEALSDDQCHALIAGEHVDELELDPAVAIVVAD